VHKGFSFAVACLVLAAALVAGAPDARAQVPVLHLEGRGFGHGVGLSQWGAKYAADAGAGVEQILGTFYPGTSLGQATGTVRVGVLTAPGGEAIVQLPQGGEVRSPREGPQAAGFPVVVAPGGSVVVRFDGSYRVTGAVQGRAASQAQCLPVLGPCPTTTTTAAGGGGGGGGDGGCGLLGCTTTTAPPTTAAPTTTAPPTTAAPTTGTTAPPGNGEAVSAEPLWVVPADGGVVGVPARSRSYRGVVQAVAGDGLRLVNEVDVETYLKGMGEVPASWPAAAQQAQAIAARTWVLRAMSASGEVCDYDRCQVYIGAGREAAGQSAAVDATHGVVLTYGGALAASVYSADAGGTTATTLEGFGTPDGTYPYLTTVRYDTPDPLPWSLDVALADLARRFDYRGTVTGVRISQAGPSGRALEIVLDGTAGPLAVDGRRFASGLGLRSTLFTPTVGDAAVAPAPPPSDAGFAEQALPDDAEAIGEAVAEAPTTGARGDIPSRAERAAGIDPRTAAAANLARNPFVLASVALLGVVTAVGMARRGLVPAGGPVLLLDRRRPVPPALALPDWPLPFFGRSARPRRADRPTNDEPVAEPTVKPAASPAPRIRIRPRQR
jgi:stage II sporulation protein D